MQRSPRSVFRKPLFFHTFSVILILSNYRKCMGKSRPLASCKEVPPHPPAPGQATCGKPTRQDILRAKALLPVDVRSCKTPLLTQPAWQTFERKLGRETTRELSTRSRAPKFPLPLPLLTPATQPIAYNISSLVSFV